MKVSIEITCDNAAFETRPGEELARILQKLAESVKGWDPLTPFDIEQNLRDANGNMVGDLVVSED